MAEMHLITEGNTAKAWIGVDVGLEVEATDDAVFEALGVGRRQHPFDGDFGIGIDPVDERVATGLIDLDNPDIALPWQVAALCAQTDPEAFFPEKGGSTREAKRVCSRCEVRSDCLEFALGHDERFGIWGGLSERERRRLKRRAG